MARNATVPQELRHGPFLLDEALSAGITRSALRSKPWTHVGKAMYCWDCAPPDGWRLIDAWKRSIGDAAVFAGYTAAWMHGLDGVSLSPIEVIVPADTAARSCRGVAVRHCDLPPSDVVDLRGFRATTICRTLRDMCLVKSPVEALVVIDMAIRCRLVDVAGLQRYAMGSLGLPGASRLRDLSALGEPAESPMETRLRWLFVKSGLPRPVVQCELRDSSGIFVGRADLFYPSARLVVEFDGGFHREHLVADNRRQNELVRAGFTVLRFTSADLASRPELVVRQVREALEAGSVLDSASNAHFAHRLAPAHARHAQNGRN